MFENSLQYVTFADRSQVENLTDYYDSLLLPSHLLAGGKKAVPSVLRNVAENQGMEYYIDPSITEFHIGDHFRDAEGNLRQWHSKLVDELGGVIKTELEENHNLDYRDLDNEEKTQAIRSLCEFQTDFVPTAIEENMGKYEDVDVEGLDPKRILPWYLKIDNLDSLRLNEDIVQRYSEITDYPLKPVIHVSKEYISDITNRRIIAEKYADFESNVCFVWVDSLNRDSSVREYRDVTHLVAKLADEGLDPQFMYGDYFSNLLYFFGLRGTSYGTYFRDSAGEKVEGGGGGNLQRYYLNPIHEFLGISDAVKAAKRADAPIPPHTGMENWGELYEFGKDHDFLKNHYIKSRDKHKSQILKSELEDLIEYLNNSYEMFSGTIESRHKSLDHLRRWTQAIDDFIENYPDLSENQIAESIALQNT